MLESVRATCQKFGLFSHGDRVVVGVSGGADSCALLLALLHLRKGWGLSLHVAHLNHCIRGAVAEEDAAFVQALADRWNLPCTVERVDVPALSREGGMSLEQAGRAARYHFFNALADAIGASKIAVGHTADDLLETMLLNWCRGAGAEGLAGMPPQLGRVVRPLFEVTRAAARAFCAANGLVPRWDASNEDVHHRRNRVRRELVPRLKRLCPSLLDHTVRLAEVLREDNACLEALAQEALSAALREEVKGGIMLVDVASLARQPLALQRRALRQATRQVKGNLQDVSFNHIEQIVHAVRHQSTKGRWTLPDGVDVILEGATLTLRRGRGTHAGEEACPVCPSPRQWRLRVPGSVGVPELDVRFEAAVVEGVPPFEDTAHKAFVDAETLGRELTVRPPRPGDRFQPLGMNGTKKVMGLLGELRVPREQRARTPLVLSRDAIVWVVGYRIDDRFKVTPRTRRTVVLRVSKGYQPTS